MEIPQNVAVVLVGESLTTPMACAFLQKWPFGGLPKGRPQRLRKFYYGQRSRAEELIQQRLQLLAQAKPLTADAAVASAQSLLVKSVARELAALPSILAEYDQQIATLFAAHADQGIWDSFPGAGPALAPRLAAAWGTQRDRFESSNAMAAYRGIAPVKQASGRSVWIHMRWACPKFLRQIFHELTRTSLSFCVWAQCYYQMQLHPGKGGQAAAPSPSNGSASCGAAGRTACPMTTRNISKVSSAITTNSTPASSLSSPHQPVHNYAKMTCRPTQTSRLHPHS